MFSFHFIPEEDRLAITFAGKDGDRKSIPPILVTRRLVKLLGGYLRQYIEKNTSLPESVSTEDMEDVLQFMHHGQLESDPPAWESHGREEKPAVDIDKARLISKVDITHADSSLQLIFKQKNTRLVSLALGWQEIHKFLYSLSEISKRAEWNLENIFEWSGRTFVFEEPGKSQ